MYDVKGRILNTIYLSILQVKKNTWILKREAVKNEQDPLYKYKGLIKGSLKFLKIVIKK